MEFVLASKSPRRVEMLKSLGFDFTVRPADIDESSISLADPETGVEKIALE
ncbi:MAG: Maf family protein, partial [Clostridia bacterium]|nr:Maf family protein [Clostridia bacterium]